MKKSTRMHQIRAAMIPLMPLSDYEDVREAMTALNEEFMSLVVHAADVMYKVHEAEFVELPRLSQSLTEPQMAYLQHMETAINYVVAVEGGSFAYNSN